jgi:hypothetical protein
MQNESNAGIGQVDCNGFILVMKRLIWPELSIVWPFLAFGEAALAYRLSAFIYIGS